MAIIPVSGPQPLLLYRNVGAVFAATGLLQIALGVLGVALPLTMAEAGWSGAAIGLVAAAYGAGFMTGAFITPAVIRSLGHIRAYAAFGGATAALTLLLALDYQIGWWLLARFAVGISAAGLFAVAESWIADATPSQNRGAVISAYQVIGRAGLILGPFLLALPAIERGENFLLAGVFLSLAIVPITATRRGQPIAPQGERVSPWRLLRIAPAAASGALTAGMVNTAILAFAPLWAAGLLTAGGAPAGDGAAAIVMAAIFGASTLVQWPLGKLSDLVDRRLVIAGASGIAAVFSVILSIWVAPGLAIAVVLIGLWGASALAYYAVCIAHAADRAKVEELPAIASGMLTVWAFGSILGPALAGLLYASPLGVRGLFVFAAIGEVALVAIMIWRRFARTPAPESQRESFVNLQTTSSELAEIPAPDETPSDWSDEEGEVIDIEAETIDPSKSDPDPAEPR